MNRSWIEQFYEQCGREVSLAYNVLNQTNTWGITLGTAVLSFAVIGTVTINQGIVSLSYPNVLHWFYAILAWIIMLRFFMRSCLALTNMYRWNNLLHAASYVLSLPDNSPDLPIFQRNFIKKVKAYYYDWKSPQKRFSIVWHSLKLMYLWFFVILLALIGWSFVSLARDWFYAVGLILFAVPTALEIRWFFTWDGLQYKSLPLEKESEITEVWLGTIVKPPEGRDIGVTKTEENKH